MIESPAQNVEEIQQMLKQSNVSLNKRGPVKTAEEEISAKILDLVRGHTIVQYFIRISWVHKLKFLDGLIKRIRSLGTMILLLDTLYTITGKIVSYSKTTTTIAMNYDKIVDDHDRMMDIVGLHETILSDMRWFEAADDNEQVAYLIAFLRISGGALVRKFYKQLQGHYRQRIRELALTQSQLTDLQTGSVSREHVEIRDDASKELFTDTHDVNDPKHQKCLKQLQLWNETITKIKKDIEKRTPKSKPESSPKKDKKGKKKKDKTGKKKKQKKEKKRNKTDNEPRDWIQIMPIWVVKKIFSYLDKKTLGKVKKVNEYWKWAAGELLKDQKALKSFNKIDKQFQDAAGGDCTLPEDAVLKQPKARISWRQKRMQKLATRGAILEELRHIPVEATDSCALVVEAIKASGASMVPYIDELGTFPRILRTNPPIYQKPAYIVKDLNLICEEVNDELSTSLEDVSRPFHLSSTDESNTSDSEIY